MKHLITIFMMAVLLTACGHRASQQAQQEAQDSTEVSAPAAFQFDNISREIEDSAMSVKVSVDWPKSDNDSLVESISRYICEELSVNVIQEGATKVTYFTDGQTAVDSASKRQQRQLEEIRDEDLSNGRQMDLTYSFMLRINLLEEGEHYITYITSGEGYMGGAHGYATTGGQTFRKSDGKRIGYTSKFNTQKGIYEIFDQTMFKNPRSKALNNILKEGLRSYFQEFQDEPVTDDVLIVQLIELDNLEDIPLPNNPPIFTKDGLSFTYQQYEIAPYAAGMPNFNIPYEKISSCLTEEAKSLIP